MEENRIPAEETPETVPAEETPETVQAEDTAETEKTEKTEKPEEAEQPTATGRRYDRKGNHRGRSRLAAPLGVLMSALSLVGVLALISVGIGAIRRATDTSVLNEEFYYFLEPVLVYNPAAFDSTAEFAEQDAFLNAAAYRVSLAEQIRMLVEKDENCTYAVDDVGRIAVPQAEIKAAYTELFGPDAVLTDRTLDEDGLVYSAADDCYYVPFSTLAAGYVAVIDNIKRVHGGYTVRIGYVATADICLDAHGNEVAPTADMATYYQTYTLTNLETEGYYLSGCVDG